MKVIDFPYYTPPFREYNPAQAAVIPHIATDTNLVISFATAVGKCVAGDTRIHMADGTFQTVGGLYEAGVRTARVLSVNESMSVEEADAIIVKMTPQKLLGVATQSGECVKVTPEHPFLVKNENGIEWICADKVGLGDFIATPRCLPSPAGAPGIDVLDFLKNSLYSHVFCSDLIRIVAKRGNGRRYASRDWLSSFLGVKKYRVANWMDNRRMPSSMLFKIVDAGLASLPAPLKLFGSNSDISITIPTRITNGIAWLSGIIVADGHIDTRLGVLKIFKEDDETLNRAVSEFKTEFGLDSKIVREKSGCRYVLVHSKVCCEFFEWLGIPSGKKSDIVSIPDIILRQENEILRSFLSGHTGGDGCGGRVIEIATDSEVLSFQISAVLRRFGIISSRKTKVVCGKKRYRVCICGKKMLEKFLSEIGFGLKRKDLATREYLSGMATENTNVDIIPFAYKEISAVSGCGVSTREMSDSVKNVLFGRRDHLSRRKAIELLDIVPTGSEAFSATADLRRLCNGDLIFRKVIAKQSLDVEDTYDLCVPGNKTFVAENVVIHNTVLAECAFGYAGVCAPDGTVMYVCPYRSIVQEKVAGWKDGHEFGVKGIAVSTGDSKEGVDEHLSAWLSVMTLESFDSKLRSTRWERVFGKVCCLVIDEAHVIGQADRGAAMESAMMRFTQVNPQSRIILLSATIGDPKRLASWLKSLNGKRTRCFKSDWRPTEVEVEVIPVDKGEFDKEVVRIVAEHVGLKTIVFVNSKRFGAALVKSIKSLGVRCAFHNASVKHGVRKKIEDSFSAHASGLDVIVATSTLSAGVNLKGD